MSYVIGIDQSTQGTKALLLDEYATLVAKEGVPHRQYISNEGYISHDPEEIYSNVKAAVAMLLRNSGVSAKDVACIGISNQRETTVAWNRKTGKPICRAIVWQCSRAEGVCKAFSPKDSAEIFAATGIPLSPYFPAAKMRWILDCEPMARRLAAEGNLCFGTIDSWLLYCMTSGRCFKTDVSNASRTQLMNLYSLTWDKPTCAKFGIDPACLPEICDSDSLFGYTDLGGVLNVKLPIYAMLGDSHASLYGHGCHSAGAAKCTYGTGSSVMMNIGSTAVSSKSGLATSLAWKMHGRAEYVLEGNINYSAAVITWMKDSAGWISSPAESESCARSANPADTTYLVPAFSGLGAPYWESEAKAYIVGMTRTTGKNELVRAGVEAIAYQISDVIHAMENDCGTRLTNLHVDGAPSVNSFLMQFQSDIADVNLRVSSVEDLSGAGAGILAGVSAGIYNEQKVFANRIYKSYTPQMPAEYRKRKLDGWHKAIKSMPK